MKHNATLVVALISAGCTLQGESISRSLSPAPAISRITPAEPLPGDTITISGSGFGTRPGWVGVTASPINDRPTILSWSDRRIVAVLDKNLTGTAEISVFAGGRHSRRIPLPMKLSCPPPADFAGDLDLGGVTSGVAYDVVRTTDCRFAVVGGATVPGHKGRGFIALIDEFGQTLPGYPLWSEEAVDWRSVTPFGDGFFLIGGDDADVVVSRVDGDGKPMVGWPKVVEVAGFEQVLGGALLASQLGAVGARDGEGFLTRIDLEGGLIETHRFTGSFENRALGVTRVLGGFAVVGTTDSGGNKKITSWTARVSADGIVSEREISGNLEMAAASSLFDNELVAVGTSGDRGATARVLVPTLYPDLLSTTQPEVDGLAALHVRDNGFVAAGQGRRDGALVRLDCAGAPRDFMAIDLGGIDRFEAVEVVYPGAFTNNEDGYLAVGASQRDRVDHPVIAWRRSFDVIEPDVEISADGEGTTEVIALGDSVTLEYRFDETYRYEIRKISGPGPDPVDSGAVIAYDDTPREQVLTFDTAQLEACKVEGCGSTVYEIIGYGEPDGRCGVPEQDSDKVTIAFQLDPRWSQLVMSSASILETYGSFGDGPPIGVSHPNVNAGGLNQCINNLGLPYGTPAALQAAVTTPPPAGSPASLDDRDPQLLFYFADAIGNPAPLAGYALGTLFVTARPTLMGSDWTVPSQWQGHYGGWHTGEGGMTIATPGHPTTIPDWRFPGLVPPFDCGDRNAFCGAKPPYIPHPALWDLHVFFDPAGGLPVIAFFTGQSELLSNPCAAVNPGLPNAAINGCDTGCPSLELNPFFTIGANGSPNSAPCSVTPEPCQ